MCVVYYMCLTQKLLKSGAKQLSKVIEEYSKKVPLAEGDDAEDRCRGSARYKIMQPLSADVESQLLLG